MNTARPALRLPTAPIWVQILTLVIGALVVAQLVTLGLTILLPPSPPPQHSLTEIAQALRGGSLASKSGRPLIRRTETAPPSLNSPGWVVSQQTTRDLADMLKVPEHEVRLLFYAPPPVAGAIVPPPPHAALQANGRILYAGYLLVTADGPATMGPPPGMGGGPMGPGSMGPGPMGGMTEMRAGGMGPGGMGPGGMGPGDFRTGPMGAGRVERVQRWPADGSAGDDMRGGRQTIDRRTGPSERSYPRTESTRTDGMRPEGSGPNSGSTPGPTMTRGTMEGGPRSTTGPNGPGAQGGPARVEVQRPPVRITPRTPLDAAIFSREITLTPAAPQPAEAPKPVAQARPPEPVPREPTRIILTPQPTQQAEAPVIETPAPVEPELVARSAPAAEPVERALPQPAAPTVFGLARAPYVEGEFVAALKTPAGWVTVKPEPEGFPNSWQRRVLIWFGLSFGLVAPLGYLLARRLAAPLGRFAAAAERLGRQPSADLAPLAGPAEVGRAAQAFNLMQQRLKRYVEDRTGMVGAISHDLRTPLARMRFKLERAPPALRAALSRDIAQMEEMITSVLSFMRDESVSAQRDSVDLRSILECVVDDAGGGAELVPGPPVAVTVDVLGMQRVFENLVDNALKYGTSARVSLGVLGDEAVVEVSDDGPGLTREDLEQVFKPFYRSQDAKASGKAGMGLGLAVSRSTVRAHGGDLTLRSGADGLVAQVRLPIAASVAIAA